MADPRLESLVASLESLMKQMTVLHAALLELLERKRAALVAGDTGAMVELCKLENEKVQQISELEKSRLESVGKLTLLLDPQATEPMHLRDLAMKLPKPMCVRLLTQRQQLRQHIEQVREQTSIAKRATESLMKHVQGLVRTIGTFTSGGAAYSDRGSTPSNAMAVGSINFVA